MEKQEAIKIIEQALNAANLKGVYSLEDVKLILNALDTIKIN
jgi:ferric-dicitrate binding protein FerR (iron transport regulator)